MKLNGRVKHNCTDELYQLCIADAYGRMSAADERRATELVWERAAAIRREREAEWAEQTLESDGDD